MNRSRKIKTPLTLCASALLTLLAFNAPVFAAEPDEELEVTMDVVDDANHADPANPAANPAANGTELVVREDHEADEAEHNKGLEKAKEVSDEHSALNRDDDLDKDSDMDKEDADHADADDTDHEDANEHEQEDVDTGDANDDGHDSTDGETHSDQTGVTS